VTWFDRPSFAPMKRAALSHALRRASDQSAEILVTMDWLDSFSKTARLPRPATQAANLIGVIGDHMAETGEGYFIDDVRDAPLVGAMSPAMFERLRTELANRGLITALEAVQRPDPTTGGVTHGKLFGLTMDGWEAYETERSGAFAGRYGFAALKFGDPILDPFLDDVVKPAVRDGVGFDLVDLRNVSRAGVIDNILRTQIRDAAFVIVDLTHDNAGAYWEAGYAEGLGKPVIYICEETKFAEAKTHFDTNHCTTVMWSVEQPKAFTDQLVATIRRSLNLFA
jgi:hypothetical protein